MIKAMTGIAAVLRGSLLRIALGHVERHSLSISAHRLTGPVGANH